ncbi:hypothetical protein PPYR_03333 [Photinus pyralis]|uniref:ABC transporter domain-containing protein n=1 Tax=Photinus pyralis TaxID=7054 RepID=A0A5N4A2I1_PHOPY|nr:ATP-binding cassette sub-family D member [Photinus pyralis]KAB0791533.1 hypothetical protein PPYR_03333 [Photinus pyralis]
MPSVISKLLAKTEATRRSLNIPRSYLHGGILAACLLAYTYKVGYPLIENLLSKGNAQQDSVNNNLLVTTNPPPAPVRVERRTRACSQIEYLLRLVPGLNVQFVLQFYKLFRIMIPSVFGIETVLLSGHTLFLFLRTFLSIYVANLEGAIVKYIVRNEPRNFIMQILKWFAIAIPATFINSTIKYLESRIALSLRTRLVEHSYKLYFKNQSYYRVTVLDGRLENCSQRLTDDIETVANMVSHLYSQITKPLFDILLMVIALANLTKSRNANVITGPAIVTVVVGLSAFILKLGSPKFGVLVAQEAEKKGYLRFIHSRLVTNSEEIAFYGGHKVELSQLRGAYRVLVRHMRHMFGVKLWFVMLEQFLMKYVWSGTGLIVVSLPILLSRKKEVYKEEKQLSYLAQSSELNTSLPTVSVDNVGERTQYFTTAKNLMLTGGNAVERLMSSYKDIVELAGHTARVANMFTVLEEVSEGVYEKTLVEKKDNTHGFVFEYEKDQPIPKGRLVHSTDEIVLQNVPIITPNCDVICASLNLVLHPGQHLLITGPNGCGKSSLFRILAGLWPIYAGELRAPKNSMFYIPQRPYMVIGNLRDQIIYPDTHTDMINKQVSEEDLRKIMHMVHLDHIVERDSFYTVRDWTDILSGGEKQRMAVARLFYHKPKYALLDECTSAISIDVEGEIYQAAINLGITLLTITHRPTLWKFHTYILQFDGAGAWEFSELNVSNLKESRYGRDRTNSE